MAKWWKGIASLLLAGHFLAVLSATLAPPAGSPSAPLLARHLNEACQPYLDALLLNSSFRFYAPDPGPSRLLWCRVEHVDGTAQWLEWPSCSSSSNRPTRLRELSIAAHLDMQLGPDSANPKQLVISSDGMSCARAYARRVTHLCGKPHNPVHSVAIYTVRHRVLESYQIADGWSLHDLRTYRPCLVGEFSPNGNLRAASLERRAPAAVESSRLAARMCIDLASTDPMLREVEIPEHWPRPIRELVSRHDELAIASGDESVVKARIEQLAQRSSTDNSEFNPRSIR